MIKLLGGAAALWSLAARAQQPEKQRRIGVLLNRAAGDPEAADSIGAFVQGMGELGWRIGGNLRIEYRYSAGNPELFRKYAAELVTLAPDAILAASTLSVAALQQLSRSIPIVFTSVSDPVGAGIVDSLARPGGNATGFMLAEFSVSGKWLELLKQVAPELKRVAVLRHSANPAGIAQFGAIQAVAASLGVAVTPIDVKDAGEIERAVAAFARSENCGMIVTGSAIATIHRELIITLAARHKLPAFYTDRFWFQKSQSERAEVDDFRHVNLRRGLRVTTLLPPRPRPARPVLRMQRRRPKRPLSRQYGIGSKIWTVRRPQNCPAGAPPHYKTPWRRKFVQSLSA